MSGLTQLLQNSRFTLVIAALLLVTQAPVPAHADFSISIGISAAKANRIMVSQGYTQIQILRKGFKTIRAQACQNGIRYAVRVDHKYRVQNTGKIGVCRNTVSIDRIQKNLEQQGYTRVVMENQNGNFVAIACQGEQRVRIVFSQQGRVLKRRAIGVCEKILEPNDIRQILRDAGYNRIKFTDRQLPWYVAEACLNNSRYELLLTRYGDIRKRTRIDRCEPPIEPDDLENVLRDKGYKRIEITDDQLPIYQAEACYENDRYALQLNRFGKLTARDRIGKCRRALSKDEIATLMRDEGFRRITVRKKSNGRFEIAACLNGYEKFATLSRFGELIRESDGGRCKPRSVQEIHQELEDRDFREVEFYSEACRKGKRIRIQYDRNGDRIGRERIGSC